MTSDRFGGPSNPSLPVLSDDLQDPGAGVDLTTTGGPVSRSVLDRAISLSELLDLSAFREVCMSFVDLYKIGIKIFDADGTKLVDIRVGNGDWCGYIFQNGTGRSKCTALVTKVKQFKYPGLEDGEVIEQHCFSGLKYVIMPITYGGDLLGRVIYGPFLPAGLQAPGDEVYTFKEGFDPNRLWHYGEKIRRAPDEMIMKILTNFRGVVDTITFIAMKALMTQQLHVESITASYNELSQANRKLRTSLEKLRELDKLKSNFLAMISHELRTPLTSVIGYSEMLIEGMAGEMNKEQSDYIQTIKDKGESLLEMISSLLDMSKIEAGAMQLAIGRVDVADLIETAKSNIVPQAAKKKVRLICEVDSTIPQLPADRDKVRQCLINLLGNAVKFTPAGGQITIKAQRYFGPRRYSGDGGRFGSPDEPFVKIVVQDSGVGIPEHKLEQIFESFYQVDNSVTREYGGTGLGLAIVKRFVEAHSGEVWVESQPKLGTTFTLLFPLEAPAGGAVDVAGLGR